MNSRIVTIRKENKLSQSAFAERLNLSRTFVSLVETGDRQISDRTISDICKTFNINETWLRTGEGDMHAPMSKEQWIASVVADLYYSSESYPFLLEMIDYVKKMDSDQIKAVYKTAKDLIDIYERNK